MKQSHKSFDEISEKIMQYLQHRDWIPRKEKVRNIAISISLEANELLEHYQWRNEANTTKDELADDLADIMIYCFQYANTMDIDIAEAIELKLKKQEEKYPVELFKDIDCESQQANDIWVQAKVRYNQKRNSL